MNKKNIPRPKRRVASFGPSPVALSVIKLPKVQSTSSRRSQGVGGTLKSERIMKNVTLMVSEDRFIGDVMLATLHETRWDLNLSKS
jgi:hypothetical protein